jgi:AAA ATPase domain
MTAMITDSSPGASGRATLRERPAGVEVVRGREAEQKMIRDLLWRAQRGAGGVLLVEGEPGVGKSKLLRNATDEAAEQGFSLAAGAADQLGQAIPFFALRAALREPVAGLAAGDPGRDLLDATAWWITQIRAHLEQRAAVVPVLVCLDDLHWASPATLAALRALPGDLKRHPVAWLLAGPAPPSALRTTCSTCWRRTVPPGSSWARWTRTRWRPCSLTPSAHRRARPWRTWPAAPPATPRSWPS